MVAREHDCYPDRPRRSAALPEEPMHGIGDLARALGGSEDSFTGQLLKLVAKADPDNRERLRIAFPRAVRAWELWMATSPTPTAGELLAALDRPARGGKVSGFPFTSNAGCGGIWPADGRTNGD